MTLDESVPAVLFLAPPTAEKDAPNAPVAAGQAPDDDRLLNPFAIVTTGSSSAAKRG
jgi:hypothetical protein